MNREKFSQQFRTFQQLSTSDGRFRPREDDFFVCLDDDTPTTGFDPHYVLHTGWAARKLLENKELKYGGINHVDFGASMYFVAIASAFVPFRFCDIRPANLPFPEVIDDKQDLTKIDFDSDSCFSVSCLHVLEHIGLGRYGDALDASGDIKAAAELSRILAPGGSLLIVVPMEDPPRVCFNAHRLYSFDQVLGLFPALDVVEFTLITNEAEFFPNVGPEAMVGRKYACGCFLFTKPERAISA